MAPLLEVHILLLAPSIHFLHATFLFLHEFPPLLQGYSASWYYANYPHYPIATKCWLPLK